ncbi:hypothetical protein Pla123a_16730 [Posidoniimonas polymericola]|uniref:Uncharacterized protein n=2 Tax=Posidoniimonas polymericola TaxID=2528002 RepID=A0A5C5YSE8_9BACT|nr:hypothetical protein Pla123a_16730 [Posidoniimonas polymericola]
MVSIHQQNVSLELIQWREEHGVVTTWREAGQTAGMLEYIQNYYVPSGGYRGTRGSEQRLEEERAKTSKAFVAGLQRFTGEDFGTDSEQWREYVRAHKNDEPRESASAP